MYARILINMNGEKMNELRMLTLTCIILLFMPARGKMPENLLIWLRICLITSHSFPFLKYCCIICMCSSYSFVFLLLTIDSVIQLCDMRFLLACLTATPSNELLT